MSPEEFMLRRVVASASGLLYWGGVMVQARRVRRQIGRSPNLKPRGKKEKALWVGWFLVIVAWIGAPFLVRPDAASPVFRLVGSMLDPATLIVGIALVGLGYAATLWCYAAMGSAWRIGVNAKEKNALIQIGPYRWVRHPIYGFQIVMLAGAALLLPCLISLAVLLFHYLCVRIKAADEERYLRSVHGEAYDEYSARAGRVLPFLG